MMALMKACAECGELSAATYCEQCKPKQVDSRPSRSAGYDARWDRLSKRARRLQAWCTDCLGTEDLTADHLPIAWERKSKGLSVRLSDVEVVCRSCNGKRGAARADRNLASPRGDGATDAPPEPCRQEEFPSLIENDSHLGKNGAL